MQPMNPLLVGALYIAALTLRPPMADCQEQFRLESHYRAMKIDAEAVHVISAQGIAGISAMAGASRPEALSLTIEKLVQIPGIQGSNGWSFEARLTNTGTNKIQIPIYQGQRKELLRKCPRKELETLSLGLYRKDGSAVAASSIIVMAYGCNAVSKSQLLLAPTESILITGQVPGQSHSEPIPARMIVILRNDIYTKAPGGWHLKVLANGLQTWSKYINAP